MVSLHRPYSRQELFGFYSSIVFTKNAKVHNLFVAVDTYECIKLTYIICGTGKSEMKYSLKLLIDEFELYEMIKTSYPEKKLKFVLGLL